MTFQIRLADLPFATGEFAERVRAHAARMNEYLRHLDRVEADKTDPGLKEEERRVAFPAPDEHDLVARAIRPERQGERTVMIADYEITGPTLEERKAALIADINWKESRAIEQNMPAARRRHWQYRFADILAADHLSGDPTRVDDPDAFLATRRSAEDNEFLALYRARQAREDVIQRWAARQIHDIDHLTEETIDGWRAEALA